MATIAEKRKKFMKMLLDTFNLLDPSGDNAKKYEKFFSSMSDDQFDKYIRKFFANDSQQFYLEIVEYMRDIKYENIEKAAKYLGVPLYETVYLPHINHDLENVTVTPEKVPVGYIHEKRMMQTLEKKNSGSTSNTQRNPLTGQVTGDDKNGRNSDVETYSLLATGAEYALKEFLGPRADDEVARNEMATAIAKNGYVSMKDLTNDKANKTSLNTLNIYFLMQGFKTNLIGSGNLLPKPKNEERSQALTDKDSPYI